jgi:hypothetical protein
MYVNAAIVIQRKESYFEKCKVQNKIVQSPLEKKLVRGADTIPVRNTNVRPCLLDKPLTYRSMTPSRDSERHGNRKK